MSLWYCPTHGVTGPMGCCASPSRATLAPLVCGKGTYNGAAAQASKFGFAPCVREKGHPDLVRSCDSGPASLALDNNTMGSPS